MELKEWDQKIDMLSYVKSDCFPKGVNFSAIPTRYISRHTILDSGRSADSNTGFGFYGYFFSSYMFLPGTVLSNEYWSLKHMPSNL